MPDAPRVIMPIINDWKLPTLKDFSVKPVPVETKPTPVEEKVEAPKESTESSAQEPASSYDEASQESRENSDTPVKMFATSEEVKKKPSDEPKSKESTTETSTQSSSSLTSLGLPALPVQVKPQTSD